MNKHFKIIDLTHKLYTDMPSYPTLPPFRIEQIRTIEKEGSNVSLITSMHTHLGTHIDFPLHMIPNSKSLDDYTLEDLCGDGVVVDLSYKGAGEEITEEDIARYSDYIREGEIVCVFTGWSKKRNHTATYLFEWPYLGESAAHFLVKKSVKMLGIDTLSIKRRGRKTTVKDSLTKTPSRDVHKILFDAGILVIEEIANLDLVLKGNKVARAFFIIAPLAIKGAEASPCRVISMVSDL